MWRTAQISLFGRTLSGNHNFHEHFAARGINKLLIYLHGIFKMLNLRNSFFC